MAITVIGLGPGDPDLLTRSAWQALATARVVWLRTAVHPSVSGLPAGPEYRNCDDLYESLDSFDAVYAAVCERLRREEREHGDAVYAVPGDPLVGEATVRALLESERNDGPPIRLVSGVSFIEAVCHRLAIDPLRHGLQIVDALAPAVDPAQPALFAQIHGRRVASHLKLTLLDLYPADHIVTLVTAAAVTGEERVLELRLADLDHDDSADHLSSLYVPPLATEQNRRTFGGLRDIVHQLYAPGGCPWDREQTHATLKPHLLEETYEVLGALDEFDPTALSEELGDLLLQVALHTEIANEAGEFDYGDVFESITSKLIRRHPHVFGDVTVHGADEVSANWQKIKQAEKEAAGGKAAPASLLAGVPKTMPALAYAQIVQDRVAAVGFDWPRLEDVLDKLLEEANELRNAETHAERLDEFGDIVFVIANLARWLKIDAEEAGRLAGRKFYRRFSGVEQLARESGTPLTEMTLADMDALWNRVKAMQGDSGDAGYAL